jgi:hypothetical protein
MAKYTSDASLISGAGKAYKNWDNVPGMYAGLDKISEAGTEIMQTALEKQEEKRKEEEAAKLKKAQQDKDWYDISKDVYVNAGSFMKDVEYKYTVAQVNALKADFIEAQESGDAEQMAAVQIEFNNIKTDIDDHKAFRETITDPDYGLSEAMKNSGVVGGDGGEDLEFMTGLIAEDYQIETIDGKKYYKVGDVSKTMKEIKDMAILKDMVPFAKYQETRQKYTRSRIWNREDATFEVKNNIVPKDFNGLRAFLADEGFGNGKNFTALLNDAKNKEAIKNKINTTLFDTDGTAGISDEEYAEFALAVVDPKHKTWSDGQGGYDNAAWQTHATEIATEQLTNGMENAWRANNLEEENKTTSGTRTTKTRQEETYMANSRRQSENIQKAVKTFDLNDLQNINLQGKYRVEKREDDGNSLWIRRISDGTYMDKLDPNNRAGAQNMLYDYGGNEYHRVPYEAPKTKTKKAPIIKKETEKQGKYAKPPNVTQEKWNSFSDMEKLNWYLQHGGK